jgi:membrane protease YdiL (CAAX protease family)
LIQALALAVEAGRFADEKADFNPRTWLSKYRRNSIGYLFKMLLFYHGIGVGLLLLGTLIVQQIIPNYQEPTVPRSLVGVLAAGPLEETVFFGVPFYFLNSSQAVIVTGSIWAFLHIFNTPNIQAATLAFGNWLFVIPSLFFSLRTWASGKGWFSIAVHSAWNGIFFAAGCIGGSISCTVFEPDKDTNYLMIGLSAALLAGTYVLYRWRNKRETAFGRIQ